MINEETESKFHPTCKTCSFWKKSRTECRRRSPVISDVGNNIGAYPETLESDWCGDHSGINTGVGSRRPGEGLRGAREAMTLEQAVRILNDRNHRECSTWQLCRWPDESASVIPDKQPYGWLNEFETAAIAEKYEREGRMLEVKLTAMDDDGDVEIVVTHNGREILRESDRMEPEDARFHRDMHWVPEAIKTAYKLGRDDMAADMIDSFCKATPATTGINGT